MTLRMRRRLQNDDAAAEQHDEVSPSHARLPPADHKTPPRVPRKLNLDQRHLLNRAAAGWPALAATVAARARGLLADAWLARPARPLLRNLFRLRRDRAVKEFKAELVVAGLVLID